MVQTRIRIAIDGPAAAGKSTVAKMIAEKLNITYIDTGAMYRALTLKALEQNINVDEEQSLLKLLQDLKITLMQNGSEQTVLVNDEDVTLDIRSEHVTKNVSLIAQHPLVREEMVNRQRAMAESGSVVMDGRDIGTHVIPDAEVKIFLIASVEERAERRHKENLKRGFTSNLEQIKKEIEQRDLHDMNRKTAPLKRAKEAIEIDTTSLSIQNVVDLIIKSAQNMLK